MSVTNDELRGLACPLVVCVMMTNYWGRTQAVWATLRLVRPYRDVDVFCESPAVVTKCHSILMFKIMFSHTCCFCEIGDSSILYAPHAVWFLPPNVVKKCLAKIFGIIFDKKMKNDQEDLVKNWHGDENCCFDCGKIVQKIRHFDFISHFTKMSDIFGQKKHPARSTFSKHRCAVVNPSTGSSICGIIAKSVCNGNECSIGQAPILASYKFSGKTLSRPFSTNSAQIGPKRPFGNQTTCQKNPTLCQKSYDAKIRALHGDIRRIRPFPDPRAKHTSNVV